jgi:hypothetical protein
MPALRSTAAARGGSQRPTSSPMSGCGRGELRSASTACVTVRAAAAPLRAVPVKIRARSSRCRLAAKAASCRRMWLITERDEPPVARRSGMKRTTASREDRPSCQARRADSAAASGSSSSGCLRAGSAVDRRIFTSASLGLRR